LVHHPSVAFVKPGYHLPYCPNFRSPLSPIKDKNGKDESITISQVKQECRQTTFKARSEQSYLAAPLFSITPTLYVTKPTNQGDLEVQPAILLGLFEDILNFGVGWNLTGPPGEKGNVFLLMSIGAGFNF
jgi:hypothetical protein